MGFHWGIQSVPSSDTFPYIFFIEDGFFGSLIIGILAFFDGL